MDYPVIKLHEKHIQSVAELEKLCFPCPWSEEQFRLALQDKFIELYGICTEEDRIVAYLLCSVIDDYAEILNIAAHPDYRQKGLAKKMLGFWFALPHIKNAHVVLEVRAKNMPAQNLYTQCGFQQIHVRKNYYGDDDALVMEWKS